MVRVRLDVIGWVRSARGLVDPGDDPDAGGLGSFGMGWQGRWVRLGWGIERVLGSFRTRGKSMENRRIFGNRSGLQ